MDKLKYIKLKNEDGSYTDSIPLAVDSNYVDVNGVNLNTFLNTKANVSTTDSLLDDINLQKTRIDNLAHLDEGSTTGDAELTDGRIDYMGITHANIGDAIRVSDETLKSSFDSCFEEKEDIILESALNTFYTFIGNGYVNQYGNWSDDNNFRSYKLTAPGYNYNIWWRTWTKNQQINPYAQVALFSSATTFDSSTFITRYKSNESEDWPSSDATKLSIPGNVSIILSIYPATAAETHTNFNKNFVFTESLQNEVGNVSKDIVENDIFTNISTNITESSDAIIHVYNGYCTTSGIVSNNDYKSYELIALKNTNVYFTYYDATYLSLCVFSNDSLTGGVRYRKYHEEDTIPYENSPLSVNAGDHLVITVQEHSYTQFTLYIEDYYATLKDIYYLNNVQLNQVKESIDSKECYLQYVEGNGEGAYGNSTTEFLNIFIPTKIGYLRYLFTHHISESVNSNIWRMYGVWATTDTFVDRHNITTTGEWEMALHLPGRPDFSGGITHGDEILTGIKFLIDGEEIDDISAIENFTPCKKLTVIESSNVYDPNDGETLIATHTSEHIWSVDGLQINQSVLWAYTGGITACYMAMHLPAKAQTDTVYMDTDYTPKVVTEAYGRYPNVKRTVVYGKTSGVYTEFSIGQYPSLGFRDSDKLLITDNSGGLYNKCYYIISADGGGNVEAGDLWKTTTNYVFKQTK